MVEFEKSFFTLQYTEDIAERLYEWTLADNSAHELKAKPIDLRANVNELHLVLTKAAENHDECLLLINDIENTRDDMKALKDLSKKMRRIITAWDDIDSRHHQGIGMVVANSGSYAGGDYCLITEQEYKIDTVRAYKDYSAGLTKNLATMEEYISIFSRSRGTPKKSRTGKYSKGVFLEPLRAFANTLKKPWKEMAGIELIADIGNDKKEKKDPNRLFINNAAAFFFKECIDCLSPEYTLSNIHTVIGRKN